MSTVQMRAAEIAGAPAVPPVSETRATGKATAGLIVQQTTYNLSKAIFNFSPPTFDLDGGLNQWHARADANAAGVVPELFPLETRVGASMALLGYLNSAPSTGLTSVVAASGTIKVMEPVLARHLDQLQDHKVAFQVAAADYDFASGSLVADTVSVGRIARSLGLPLLASSLALPHDAQATSFLTAVVASNVAPAFHVYDGIRGTRQAFTRAQPLPAAPLPTAASLLDAFEATNRVLGTSLAPFEYYGPKQPHTVYVTLGEPDVLAAQSDSVGVINVRLYSPFLREQFVSALPSTATQVVVVGKTDDLYKDVSATVRLHFGFKSGPLVQSVVTGFSDRPFVPALPETGPVLKVWDLDKSSAASAAATLAAPVPEANVFTRFDNLVAGGAVQTDLRLQFENQFWNAEAADIVYVHNASLLRSYDVTETAREGGVLVVAAASDDDLAKAVPGQIKLNAYAKGLKIYRIDYAKIETGNTQGRTISMAAQAVFWLLAGSNVDTATSRIVHANGRDTELVAATVNKIVTTVNDTALVRVALEVVAEWAKVEISDKEKELTFAPVAAVSSFVPVEHASTATDDDAVEPGLFVDNVSSLGLKKRLVFREAFQERTTLRPDVPAKTAVARVKLNQRVTPDEYDRHIFQLELDISGTGLTYAIGEALGIHAPNSKDDVLAFFEWYGIDPEEIVGVPLPAAPEGDDRSKAYRTAYQLFRDNLDVFGKVPKRFFEMLAAYASDAKEKAHLEKLASAEGASELKSRTEEDFENYADILRAFPSAKPPLSDLVDMVAPLKRREYSIASSQKVHPNEVHLLIVVVDWVNKQGERRFGQCSKFLADLKTGAEVVVSVKPSVMKLPQDPATPIIMAGLGTGLAPFKAFLEEKMWQRDQGHKIGGVYLFLGSRHQKQEYLYGELFEAYKAAGILTHIGAAFSRDQPEKIYIQHRIQQAQEDLVDAFVNKNGNFYLCGPTWPVPDISAALTEIVQVGASRNGTAVDESRLIEDLKEQERYILEVY